MRWLPLLGVFFLLPAHADVTGLRDIFLAQVTQEASANNIPPAVADAVAMVETGYRPNAIGSSGEIGIMQILPSTAAALGFRGTVAELFEPSINIHLAVQYLGRAWAESGGDVCRALTKYRAGLGTEITTPLSAQYCARAMAWLMGSNSQLATTAALPPTPSPPVSIDDPHVIRMVPIPVSTMAQAAPIVVTPQIIRPAADAHRRAMAKVAAGLQAGFDLHVRSLGTQATTRYDPDE